jgi:hypothetical protein
VTDADDLRASRLALAEALAKELARLGMTEHLPHLRTYYAAVRDGREPGKGEWNDAHVVSLAQCLRVPPHEHDLPVQTRNSTCGCPYPAPFTVATFPGGCRSKCGNCKAEWLELAESHGE